MAKLATKGTIYAFEPSVRGNEIQQNLELNSENPLGNVIIERACVGRSSNKPSSEAQRYTALGDYIKGNNIFRVDVIKIDVDGPRLEVLDGALGLLKEFRPAICVEAHSHELLAGVLKRLQAIGYSTKVIDPPPYEHRPIEYNPTVFASFDGIVP